MSTAPPGSPPAGAALTTGDPAVATGVSARDDDCGRRSLAGAFERGAVAGEDVSATEPVAGCGGPYARRHQPMTTPTTRHMAIGTIARARRAAVRFLVAMFIGTARASRV